MLARTHVQNELTSCWLLPHKGMDGMPDGYSRPASESTATAFDLDYDSADSEDDDDDDDDDDGAGETGVCVYVCNSCFSLELIMP